MYRSPQIPCARRSHGAGAVDLVRTKTAMRMDDIEPIEGAGHWVQREQPVRLSTLLLAFMKEVGESDHLREQVTDC